MYEAKGAWDGYRFSFCAFEEVRPGDRIVLTPFAEYADETGNHLVAPGHGYEVVEVTDGDCWPVYTVVESVPPRLPNFNGWAPQPVGHTYLSLGFGPYDDVRRLDKAGKDFR